MSKIKDCWKQECFSHSVELKNRWERSDHHDEANSLVRDLADLDYAEYNNHFGWKVGGDGDNGETLIEQVSILLELRDAEFKEAYLEIFARLSKNLANNKGSSLLQEAFEEIKRLQ